jgi:DNA processing protein
MTPAVLSDAERLNWLRLSQSENVGPITFARLLERYGSAEKAIEALPELSRRGGMKRPLTLLDKSRAEDMIAAAQKSGARFLGFLEPGYPEWLRQIPSVPPLICYCGNLDLANKPAIGIVGARNASAVAMKFARQLSRQLVERGYIIVSGLARGIDTAAHDAATPGNTIAVIANGIDYFYPPENEKLQRAIAGEGLLISEFVPGTTPKAEYFPRRNRIISGLSQGIIVVEAAMRSGSLITARFANEQGRQVFAVPGSPLDPRCEGTNNLIKEGATMLTSVQDVLDAMGYSAPDLSGTRLGEPEVQKRTDAIEVEDGARIRVLELLSPTAIEFDDLIRESKFLPEVTMAILLELEIAGRVRREGGGRIALVT